MKKKSRIKKRKQSKKHSGSRNTRKKIRKKPKKPEKTLLLKSEFPDFGLSNSIQPIIDFSTLLGDTIKPLQAVQLTLNEKIKPFESQLNNFEQNFPNLSAINTFVTENLKPFTDLKIKLDETTKPLIDFANQVDTTLKPLTDIGIKLNENFPNILAIDTFVTENLKPFTDLKIKLDETTKPLIDFANQVDTTLKPLSEIKFDVDPQLKSLADFSTKLQDQLIPITKFNNDLLNFTPENLFPTKPLVNFATNFGSVSNEVNKELLGNTLSYYNLEELAEVEEEPEKIKKKKAKALIKKLMKCKPGKKYWSDYEDICKEILCYCFLPTLNEPMVQEYNYDKTERRDLVFTIPQGLTGFWGYILIQYGEGIIIDCKNYNNEIPGNEVTITAKYLGAKKLTSYGLIISRRGLSPGGKTAQRNCWKDDSKMIISLSDNDLVKMLELKDKDDDPWKVLDQLNKKFKVSL